MSTEYIDDHEYETCCGVTGPGGYGCVQPTTNHGPEHVATGTPEKRGPNAGRLPVYARWPVTKWSQDQ